MEELEYCRLCLRRNLRLIAISKNVQKSFLFVTDMDLIKVLGLSSLICQLCERQLNNAKKYREKLLEGETKLQNELKLLQKIDNESTCSLAIERVIDTDDLIIEEVYFDLMEEEILVEKFEDYRIGKEVMQYVEPEDEEVFNEDNEIESVENFDESKNYIALSAPENFMQQEITEKLPSPDPLKVDKKSSKPTSKGPKKLVNNFKLKISLDDFQTSGDGKVICPYCTKAVIKSYIKHHIARLHLSIKNFICDFCNKQFYKRNAIENHMNTHLSTRPFGCSDCDKNFASRTALSTHIRFHHTTFHKYICEGCGKAYKQKRLLEEHCRSQHTGERIFKCHFENCDSAFFSNGAFLKHQKSHKSPPHTETCEMCGGKFFKNLSNLQAHMRLAHSNVVVLCDFPGCNKQFANRCFLENHKKSHECLRSFQCEFCQKTFARKRHMQRHVETTHLRTQNIQCQVENCNKVLSRKEIYGNHLKKVHKNLSCNEIEELMNFIKKIPMEKEIIEYLDYEVLDDSIEEKVFMK